MLTLPVKSTMRVIIVVATVLILVTYIVLINAKNTKLAKRSVKVSHHIARLNQKNKNKNDTKKVTDIAKKHPLMDWHREEWCHETAKVLHRKELAVKRISKVMRQLLYSKEISNAEKEFHISSFRVFQQEMNETEEMVMNSLEWLHDVLEGDYKDIINMHSSTKLRLEALRDATLREEQEYNTLLKAEEQLKEFNRTKVEGILDEILRDVSKAANKLEKDLDSHVFENAVQNPDLANGANIEAVIRLEDENKPNKKNSSGEESGGIIKLVDAQDNQFVLARGKDSTVPHEDPHFIQDVVVLMLMSFTCGWLCTVLGMPSMFGQILGGIILGPSGFNILKSLVQVETVGEFGVFFILFAVGLEFSPESIKKVLKVSLMGSTLMMGMMMLVGLGLGYMLDVSPNESSFVAACLSLSSTPLIVRFLAPAPVVPPEESAPPGEYGKVLMGILVMQDILLGILMALLPNMANASPTSEHSLTLNFIIAARLLCALALVLLVTWILSKGVIGYLYKYLFASGNKESIVLASVSIVFIMLLATEYLKISMEVGCFLAGVMISAQGPHVAEQVESLTQPIKDFLACVFFASIGLHIFPSFLAYELTYLVTFTTVIVLTKFLISLAVLAMLIPRSSHSVKWMVSAGLAQVSEFSFVLGSRARRLQLISREVYLLILSVTTLSLLVSPLLWKLSLWQFPIKAASSSRSAVGGATPVHRDTPSPASSTEEEFVVVSVSPTNQDVVTQRRTISK